MQNFSLKFHRFIYWNPLHVTAKQNMISLKNDKVIDFNMTAYWFLSTKNV